VLPALDAGTFDAFVAAFMWNRTSTVAGACGNTRARRVIAIDGKTRTSTSSIALMR
jgi:hypothetical protein